MCRNVRRLTGIDHGSREKGDHPLFCLSSHCKRMRRHNRTPLLAFCWTHLPLQCTRMTSKDCRSIHDHENKPWRAPSLNLITYCYLNRPRSLHTVRHIRMNGVSRRRGCMPLGYRAVVSQCLPSNSATPIKPVFNSATVCTYQVDQHLTIHLEI